MLQPSHFKNNYRKYTLGINNLNGAGERQHCYSIQSEMGMVELHDLHGEINLYNGIYKKTLKRSTFIPILHVNLIWHKW